MDHRFDQSGHPDAGFGMPASFVDVQDVIEGAPLSIRHVTLIALCFSVIAADGAEVGLMGFVAPLLSREWNLGAGGMSLIMSATPAGLIVGSLAVGPLSDTRGRRPLLIISVACFALTSMVSAYAHTPIELAAWRCLTGIWLGAAMPTTSTLLSEYLPARHRLWAVTAMFTGFSLGAAVVGFAAAALLPVHGWRGVFVGVGFISLLLVPMLMLWLPESPRWMAVRQLPASAIAIEINQMLSTHYSDADRFICGEPSTSRNGHALNVIMSSTYRGISRALWAAYFLGLSVIYMISNWLPSWMNSIGLDLMKAAHAVAYFKVGGTIGALVIGGAMARFGGPKILTFAFLLGAAVLLLASAVDPMTGALPLLMFCAGLCISGAQTGLNAFAPTCYPTDVRATGVSWMLGIGRVGSIAGSALGGVLISAGLGFDAMFSVLAAVALAAAAVIGWAWRWCGRPLR